MYIVCTSTSLVTVVGPIRMLDGEADEPRTLLPPAESAPRSLIVFLGALVTPTVVLGFTILHSVWLTFLSLYYLWVVAPSVVCLSWPGSRQRMAHALQRGLRRWRLQALLALLAIPVLIGTTLLTFHLFAPPLGLSPKRLQPGLGIFGLTPAHWASDVGALTWLTFLNPLMEEAFWRLFIFNSLWIETPSAWARWWAPALATSVLYASYHVPVILNFLPVVLVMVGFVFLVAFGVMLQLVVERYGLILAVGVHLAGDAAVSLIVTDMLWKWGLTARL